MLACGSPFWQLETLPMSSLKTGLSRHGRPIYKWFGGQKNRLLLRFEKIMPTVTLTTSQLALRLLPMLAVAWTRTYAVILPGIMATHHLTAAQGGQFVAWIEAGQILSLLVLGSVIDRFGGARTLHIGLPILGASVFAVTFAGDFTTMVFALVFVGTGISWTGAGINTLMASTGERRVVYLGWMHSWFGLCAVLAPLVASVIIAWSSWEYYYRMVTVVAFILTAVVWVSVPAKRPPRRTDERVNASTSTSGEATGTLPSVWSTLGRLFSLCLALFTFAGIQGILTTWSYLHMEQTYGADHGWSTLAPTALWVGILVGRASLIPLSHYFSTYIMLRVLCLFPLLAVLLEILLPSYWGGLGAVLLAGLGVSGTFQLGTTWAAELTPERVGMASTTVMGSTAVGLGLFPWLAGMSIDASSFAAIQWMTGGLSLMALILLGLTRCPRPAGLQS